jgi:putative hydrolase of the HAD superfamily
VIKAILFDCFGVVLSVYSDRNQPMIDFIHSLRPQYKLALVSNVNRRESLDIRFNEGELDQLFDVVVASGEVGVEKPDAQIYQLATDWLGVLPEECLFVDDIPEFCAAAEQLGMQSVRCIDTELCIAAIKQKLGGLHASES